MNSAVSGEVQVPGCRGDRQHQQDVPIGDQDEEPEGQHQRRLAGRPADGPATSTRNARGATRSTAHPPITRAPPLPNRHRRSLPAAAGPHRWAALRSVLADPQPGSAPGRDQARWYATATPPSLCSMPCRHSSCDASRGAGAGPGAWHRPSARPGRRRARCPRRSSASASWTSASARSSRRAQFQVVSVIRSSRARVTRLWCAGASGLPSRSGRPAGDGRRAVCSAWLGAAAPRRLDLLELALDRLVAGVGRGTGVRARRLAAVVGGGSRRPRTRRPGRRPRTRG